MKKEIEKTFNELKAKIQENISSEKIEELRIKYLGRKGEITKFLKSVGELTEEKRREIGKVVNEVKSKSEKIIQEKINELKEKTTSPTEKTDIYLAGKKNQIGHTHPLTKTRNEILKFFNQMGFVTVRGNEIETDYYNFEALNISEGHPARDDQDSFYLGENKLLRTQTSPVQIRVMEKSPPPLAIVSPGRVFRRDTLDATHSFCFHQIEGLLVDKNMTFSDLKGILTLFCKRFFGDDLKIRFRTDYFPFTEPSCEISIQYLEKEDGWLEILGAGMVNPLVLRNCHIDDKVYNGFAFGLGVERIAMLRYGIKDIRMFYENDFAFLRQF